MLIIPMWANMLVVSHLNPFVRAEYVGDENKVRGQIPVRKTVNATV
jgi:hypothetical protein